MYEEASTKIPYTGRKIRIARQENVQTEEKTARVIRRQPEDVPKHQDPSHSERSEPRRINHQNRENTRTPQNLIDENGRIVPKEKLIRSIERSLRNPTDCNLIGIFGMNSDNLLYEAFGELRYNSNIILLDRTYLMEDAYTMFAAMMLKFAEENLSRNTNRWITNQILRYIREIGPNREDNYYYDGLSALSALSQRLDRGKKCKELIQFMKRELNYSPATRFVWNIEIGIGHLTYDLLRQLSDIASEDLLIIVNSLGSATLETRMLANSVGDPGSGYNLLQKFFSYDNLIYCDN